MYINSQRGCGPANRNGCASVPALLRGGENKVHLYKNLHHSSNTVGFNKSRCLRFQFLKLCLVKKEKKKRKKKGEQKKCKEENTFYIH